MDTDDHGYRALRAIRRIIRQVGAHSRRTAASSGLTVPQLLCMRAIRDSTLDEVTVAAVADTVSLSRSTVSVIIEKLVKAGSVTRVRSEVDRRRVHLSLTENGAAHLKALPLPLQDRFVSRLAAMEPAQRDQVLGTLELVVEMMDAEALDAAPMLVPGVELPRT